jgi:hypothetical protein
MNPLMLRKTLPWASALLFINCLFQSDQAKRGSVVDNEVRVGMIFLADGKPAANARVQVFPVGHVPEAAGLPKKGNSSALVFSTRTDKDGRYSLDSLPKGPYNILGDLDGEYSYSDSVFISDTTRTLASDTLKDPGSITGIVALEPNHDRRTAFVQVLGTNIFVNADADGRFTLKDMSRGSYSLRVVTTFANYTPYFGGIRVRSGQSDTLADTLRMVFTGIPVVRNLQGSYDTAQAMARLAWTPTKYDYLKEYLVYRTEAKAINPSSLPIARTKDTVFIDSLAALASGGWPLSGAAPKFEYQVLIRNLSNETGLAFGTASIEAVPVAAVKTVLTLNALGGSETGFSIGDSAVITLTWENPTRGQDSLEWSDQDGLVLRKRPVSGLKGADTLRLKLSAVPGPFAIRVRMKDAADANWEGRIVLNVLKDAPVVKASLANPEVSVSDKVALNAKISQAFGSIARYEWDFGNTGTFVPSSTGDTNVTVPAVPGVFLCIARVTDDDGNRSADTLGIKVVLDPPVAIAGRDTTVTISDSVALHGMGSDKYGRIVKWEWNIGTGGQFVEAPFGVAAVKSRSTPGYDTLILRVSDDDGNASLDTLRITVKDDFPLVRVSAANLPLAAGSGYKLTALAEDFGRIVKWEWSTDTTGVFMTRSRGDTSFFPQNPVGGNLRCRVRATDDDGHSVMAEIDVLVSRWSLVGSSQAQPPLAVIGGRIFAHDNTAGLRNRAILFDPASGNWSSFNDDMGYEGAHTIAIGSKLYTIGPEGIYEYDADARITTKRTEAGAFIDYGVTEYGGKIYAAGEANWNAYFNGPMRYFARFDANANSWESLPPLPLKIYRPGIEALNGKVYLFGKFDNSMKPGLYSYDIALNTWEQKAPPPYQLSENDLRPWSAVVNGMLYAGIKGTVLEYDPVSDVWKRKSPPVKEFDDVEAVAVDGKIYLLSKTGVLQVYDTTKDP